MKHQPNQVYRTISSDPRASVHSEFKNAGIFPNCLVSFTLFFLIHQTLWMIWCWLLATVANLPNWGSFTPSLLAVTPYSSELFSRIYCAWIILFNWMAFKVIIKYRLICSNQIFIFFLFLRDNLKKSYTYLEGVNRDIIVYRWEFHTRNYTSLRREDLVDFSLQCIVKMNA